MNKWISVDDRLPPEDGTHYIIANFRNRPSWQAIAWYEKVHDQHYYTGKIPFWPSMQTHWMPLPPPPEEELKEKNKFIYDLVEDYNDSTEAC